MGRDTEDEDSSLEMILKNVLESGGNPNFLSTEDLGERRSLLFLCIQEAVQTEDFGKVDLLLSSDATDPSLRYEKTGANCLDLAVEHKNVDLARKILRKKPGIVDDKSPHKKVAALHSAVYQNDLEMAALLLLYQANPNITDRFGQTPIFFAQTEGMAALLLDHNADVLHLSEKGQCALHVTAGSGNRDALRFLLKKIPECIDLQDENGRTPLHVAAGKGWDHCCAALLDYGADMWVRTHKGKSAICFAESQGEDETAYYLHVRWTGSRQASWSQRMQNPPFLFAVAILGVACVCNKKLLWDVVMDVVDPVPLPGNLVIP